MAGVPNLERMKERLEREPNLLLRAAWVTLFRIPPNDDRLLRLSDREIAEHVTLVRAMEVLMAEKTKESDNKIPTLPSEPVIVRGPEAEAIADVATLTGDPEFDAIELDAVKKPPFPPEFLAGL